jgi:hypothetical protein
MSSTYEKMIGRVQALLNKAESTNFPEEADALFAKAQELMTRYAIDESLARGDKSRSSKPTLRSFTIEDPYRSAKRSLLTAVASANDVTVIIGHLGSITLAGYPSDIEVTELVFASLLVQATREMHMAVAQHDPGRLRAFRHAFLLAYGTRIGERLRAAKRAATHDAEVSTGMSLVPVMAQRRDDVDAFVKEKFPRAGKARATSVSHRGGIAAGVAAADRADLGQRSLDEQAS